LEDPIDHTAAIARAEEIVTHAQNEAGLFVPSGVLLLHWRVHRALVRLIAEALEPDAGVAAASTGCNRLQPVGTGFVRADMHAAYSARFGDCA
jgi:hypothetical protein